VQFQRSNWPVSDDPRVRFQLPPDLIANFFLQRNCSLPPISSSTFWLSGRRRAGPLKPTVWQHARPLSDSRSH
jgi:hypothetical protein